MGYWLLLDDDVSGNYAPTSENKSRNADLVKSDLQESSSKKTCKELSRFTVHKAFIAPIQTPGHTHQASEARMAPE